MVRSNQCVLYRDIVLLIATIIVAIVILSDLYYINYARQHKPYSSFEVYEAWYRKLTRLPAKERQIALLKALQKYDTMVLYDSDNPLCWRDQADLTFALFQLSPTENKALLLKSAVALKKAIAQMPAWGRQHHKLAVIYQNLQQLDLADRYMAIAQILIAHDLKLAVYTADYWAKRYRQTGDKVYLPLLAERYYLLNKVAFAEYGEKIFAIWSELAPDISIWGNVIPEEESNALSLAQFFLQHREFSRMQEALSHVVSGDYLTEKYIIEGHGQLYGGDFENALKLYKQALSHCSYSLRKQYLREITEMMVGSGHLQLAMLLLQKSDLDSQESRLDLFIAALSLGQFIEVIPMVEETREQFTRLSPKLHYVLSRCYLYQGQNAKAVDHAEQAFIGAPTSKIYAKHLLQILVALGLKEKAAWYSQRYGIGK